MCNEQDVEDVIQEAYLRLPLATTTKVLDDPGAYFFRMSRNLVWDAHSRRRLLQSTVNIDALVDTSREPGKLVENEQMLMRLG